MKLITFILAGALGLAAYAHDEGHGPKLADSGKYGGLVTGVVAKSDASKKGKAELIHKAELVRASDGMVRVYLYDKSMKALDVKGFDAKGTAEIGSKVKGKWKATPFALELKDGAFVGNMPKPESKPYSIDVTLTENGKALLSAFENLD